MKKDELLRDTGIIGTFWAAVLAVIFALPDVSALTKYQLAGLASAVTVIVGATYFGWDTIIVQRSLFAELVSTASSTFVLMSVGYLFDAIVYATWEWVTINGVLVVTWVNLLGLTLLFLSALSYYWTAKGVLSFARSLKKRSPRNTPRK